MRTVRTLLACVLLLAAVVAGLGGVAGRWLDAMANSSAPTQEIIAPLVAEPAVTEALARQLEGVIVRRLPDSIDSAPILRAELESLIATAVDRALAEPAVADAWLSTISATRQDFVDQLDASRDDPSVTPTVRIDLAPFARLAQARLVEAAPAPLQPYLEDLSLQESRLAVYTPTAGQATAAAETIWAAGYWRWLLLAAGILTVVGLVVGPRGGRWLALLLAALIGLGLTLLARLGLSGFELGEAPSLGGSLAAATADNIAASLLEWTAAVPWVLAVAAVVGGLGLVISARTRGRLA